MFTMDQKYKIGTASGGAIAVPLFNIIGDQLFIVFSGMVLFLA